MHTHARTHTRMHARAHACTHAHTHARTRTRMHARAHLLSDEDGRIEPLDLSLTWSREGGDAPNECAHNTHTPCGHTHTHTHRERAERDTHTHTQRERGGERERDPKKKTISQSETSTATKRLTGKLSASSPPCRSGKWCLQRRGSERAEHSGAKRKGGRE